MKLLGTRKIINKITSNQLECAERGLCATVRGHHVLRRMSDPPLMRLPVTQYRHIYHDSSSSLSSLCLPDAVLRQHPPSAGFYFVSFYFRSLTLHVITGILFLATRVGFFNVCLTERTRNYIYKQCLRAFTKLTSVMKVCVVSYDGSMVRILTDCLLYF